MPQDSYIYGTAMARSYGAGLIDREDMDKLIAQDAKGAMRYLSEKGYGGGEELPIDEFERLIENELKRAYLLVNEITPDKPQTDIFLLRADIHNVKTILKHKAVNAAGEPLYMIGGLINVRSLESMAESGDFYGFPGELSAEIKRIASEFEQDKDPVMLSVRLDDAYFSFAAENGNDFVRKYFRALIDFDNLITLMRVKKMGADRGFLGKVLLTGGSVDKQAFVNDMDVSAELLGDRFAPDGCASAMKEGTSEAAKCGKLYPVERERDNYLIALASDSKGEMESIEPVIGYLLAREQEAKCLRLILTLKRNGIGEDIIRERLGELYG